ncbi:RidA family protein [Flavobacteriaceae bacterium Ap0902]|nr:RidA family protein [Flavobacteriaceae bacterium Ap0902]
MEFIKTDKAPKAIGPYSQAVIHNHIIYTSGQIAIDPSTNELKRGTPREEAKLVMKNLKAILEKAGTDFSKVIKSTIFLKNMDDFAVINEVYGSYLDPEKLPARETVQVAQLPKNVHVEISMIAVI